MFEKTIIILKAILIFYLLHKTIKKKLKITTFEFENKDFLIFLDSVLVNIGCLYLSNTYLVLGGLIIGNFIILKLIYKQNIFLIIFLYFCFYYLGILFMKDTMLIFQHVFNNNLIIILSDFLAVLIGYYLYNCLSTIFDKEKIDLLNLFLVIFLISCLIINEISYLNYNYFIRVFIFITTIFTLLIYFITSVCKSYKSYQEFSFTLKYIKASEKLLEEYRFIKNENEKQLTKIMKMVNSSNPNISNYIEKLLDAKKKDENKDIKNLSCIKIQSLKNFLLYQLEELNYFNNNIEININSNLKKVNHDTLNDLLLEKICFILFIMFKVCSKEISKSNLKKFIFSIKLENNYLKLELKHVLVNANIKRIDYYGVFSKKYKKSIKNILDLYPELELINCIDNNTYKEVLLIHFPKIKKLTN